MKLVLDLGEIAFKVLYVMIIDHCDGADAGTLLFTQPFGFGDEVLHGILDRFGSMCVS
jgi:hypothetical protein